MPVFWMVKVRVKGTLGNVAPKSVPSVLIGVLSPSTIVLPSPCTLISGVNPVTVKVHGVLGLSQASFAVMLTEMGVIPVIELPEAGICMNTILPEGVQRSLAERPVV